MQVTEIQQMSTGAIIPPSQRSGAVSTINGSATFLGVGTSAWLEPLSIFT